MSPTPDPHPNPTSVSLPRHHAESGWASAYIFPTSETGGPHIWRRAFDRLILDVVAPFAERVRRDGAVRRYFFIRYGEYGPHVRLRLNGDPATLTHHVAPALEAALSEENRAWGVPHASILDVGVASGVPGLYWIPYEPEFDRYGGPSGVRAAEDFFEASSDLVVRLLRPDPNLDYETRLAKGAAVMACLMGAFSVEAGEGLGWSRSHRSHWADSRHSGGPDPWALYEARFQEQSGVVRDRLRSFYDAARGGALPPPLDAYARRLRSVRAEVDAIVAAGEFVTDRGPVHDPARAAGFLAPSYLHMTNNRLGVAPSDEGYLAHLLLRSVPP